MSDIPSIADISGGDFPSYSQLGEVHLFAETESTNTLALAAQEDGGVFLADVQTAGRGRRGNSWHSAPGKGLWFTVCLKGAPVGLTFLAALAVHDGLVAVAEELGGSTGPSIKWPNDILWDGKKCCGILVEAKGGYAAMGIGLNVKHGLADFPEELRETASSVELATGHVLERRRVLEAVLGQLDKQISAHRGGGQDAIWERWSRACGIVNRRVSAPSGEGVVESVNRDGSLQVLINEELVMISDQNTLLQL